MGPWPEALLGLCGLELPKGVGQDGWVMDYALLCSGAARVCLQPCAASRSWSWG